MEKEGFDLANELYPDVLGQKIELVYGDNKSDRAEATLAAQSLVDKGVVAVLGLTAPACRWRARSLRRKRNSGADRDGHQPTVTLDCEWYARLASSIRSKGRCLRATP